MKLRCAWEHNGADSLLYSIDYIGAYTRGENLEAAKLKMTEEILSYLRWLEDENTYSEVELEIVEEKNSTLNIKDADSDIIFEKERKTLSIEEYLILKETALKSALDFQVLYDSVPDKNKSLKSFRKTFYGDVPLSAKEMYVHTKNVNEYYFSEISVHADNDGNIYECRKRGFEKLETNPEFLKNSIFLGSWGEEWSLRKLLRRFVWHDRIHAKAMYRNGIKIFGPQNLSNPFCF